MNNIIGGTIPLNDLTQDDYKHGPKDEGEEEEEECGEEDEESQVVHDAETRDDIKLPKGNRGRTWRPKKDAALRVVWMGLSQYAIIGA